MRSKFVLKCLFVICLLVLADNLFARGGGGGGHGGGGHSSFSHSNSNKNDNSSNNDDVTSFGDIVMIVLAIITFSFVTSLMTFIYLKSVFSKKIIEQASKNDNLWNFNDMKLHAKNTFYKIQVAWENRDINSIENIITSRLYSKYDIMLKEMIQKDEKNLISKINIEEIFIISCEDFLDDNKDRFVACIRGTILDYTIIESTKKIIKNYDKTEESFMDNYHFVRKDNYWLLEDIDNSVNIWSLFSINNSIEK